MSSLAAKLGPYMGKYDAGLWEHRILIMLQWESFDGSTRSRRCGTSYCAPTFSWGSRTGGAVWYFTLGKMLEEIAGYEFAEVIEVRSELAKDAMLCGKISSSTISLCGRTVLWHIADQEPDRIGRLEFADTPAETYVQMDTQDDIDELLLASRGPEGPATVVCFGLMRNSGANDEECFVGALVLRPVQDQRGLFRRIGFSIMKPSAFSEYAVFATVVII